MGCSDEREESRWEEMRWCKDEEKEVELAHLVHAGAGVGGECNT